MADVPGAQGAQNATGGIKDTLTRKVGPLPLWAYAGIAGGLVLAFRLYTGQAGGAKSGVASVTSAQAGGGGGKPAASAVGGIIRPEPDLPSRPNQTMTAPQVSTPPLTVTPALVSAPAKPTGFLEQATKPLVTTATSAEGIIPANAFIQWVDGVPISLSNYAVQKNVSLSNAPGGALAGAGQGIPLLPGQLSGGGASSGGGSKP